MAKYQVVLSLSMPLFVDAEDAGTAIEQVEQIAAEMEAAVKDAGLLHQYGSFNVETEIVD